jgi:hypothetical protein
MEEQSIACPYCGEQQTVLIDCSEEEQQYIEDCQVCCKPIVFKIQIAMNGDVLVSVHSENDADW